MSSLSVVVITLNEEHNIGECLASVAWAGEAVVVDSCSSDRTVALARQHGARVVARPFTDYADQKNFALAQAGSDWVLSLDADERVPETLAAEIRRAVADPGDFVGYEILRRDRTFGRWLRHGLSWPQPKLRLIQRNRGRWQGVVHEVIVADGPVGRLRNPMLHYHCESIGDFMRRADHYTTMEARAWQAAGVRPSLSKLLLYPPALFAYSYVWRLGFLDGRPGLILAILMAYYTFLKRAKLWELNRPPSPALPPS